MLPNGLKQQQQPELCLKLLQGLRTLQAVVSWLDWGGTGRDNSLSRHELQLATLLIFLPDNAARFLHWHVKYGNNMAWQIYGTQHMSFCSDANKFFTYQTECDPGSDCQHMTGE